MFLLLANLRTVNITSTKMNQALVLEAQQALQPELMIVALAQQATSLLISDEMLL